MQSHADPLVQRVLSRKPVPVAYEPDSSSPFEERAARERGLSASALDRLVQEAVFEARQEERIAAERERAVAKSRAYSDGYSAGVAAAVEVLASDMRGTATRLADAAGALDRLMDVLNDEVKPGPGLPAYLYLQVRDTVRHVARTVSRERSALDSAHF